MLCIQNGRVQDHTFWERFLSEIQKRQSPSLSKQYWAGWTTYMTGFKAVSYTLIRNSQVSPKLETVEVVREKS